MTDREFRKRLHRTVDGRFSCLKDDPYLAGKVLKNNEKGERFMKKKLAFTPLVVLIAVLCCAALAAGGFGLRDFLTRYRSVDLPENWETYVQTPVLTMETEDVTLMVSELLYDGKCLRLTAECTPKKAGVMLIGEDAEPYDRMGAGDERTVCEVYAQVTCRVTDEKAYDARGKECFFEFVDPDGDGTDTLREGLSSTEYQTFPDEDGCFTACGSLAYSEVRDTYTVRLYDPFHNGALRKQLLYREKRGITSST